MRISNKKPAKTLLCCTRVPFFVKNNKHAHSHSNAEHSLDFVGSNRMVNITNELERIKKKNELNCVGASCSIHWIGVWRVLRKTHRNLMHLKRKIYFSILAVVNFKINMEMGFCRRRRQHLYFQSFCSMLSLHFDCSMTVQLYAMASTSQSIVVWLRIGVILGLCTLYTVLLMASFSLLENWKHTKKWLVTFIQRKLLQWYLLQWDFVTVCLQPHVKHEWNNRYSHFFFMASSSFVAYCLSFH